MKTLARKWWVHSQARISGHRSKVGPFDSAAGAAKFVYDERPVKEWTKVSITSTVYDSDKGWYNT